MFRPVKPSWLPASLLHTIFAIVMTLAFAFPTPLRAQGDDNPLEASGVQASRGSLSILPWEQIDTYSGSLVLVFTDLVLPGNGGLDLRVTRTFNSKGQRWTIAIGPSMNLNQVGGRNPRIQMPDGGRQDLFQSAPSSGVYYTTSLWRYTASTRTLETPDGRIYRFLSDGRLSQIADTFGNSIDVSYESNCVHVYQHLPGHSDREVWLYQDQNGRVTSVQDATRTWTYTWDSTSFANLIVTPPIGPSWTFAWTVTGVLWRGRSP